MVYLTKDKTYHIDDAVREFLFTQLGENPHALSCHLNNEIVTVYAFGVASPAELNVMKSGDQKMLIDFKSRQFESVKDELKEQISTILGRDVGKVHSAITEDGLRIINFCLKEY
ncbi:MAG: DUF2294 family protein [Calditrichae bacterium]|nr:DUF2294 family protein [Calditrichota bacterium]MCB9058648.1 DUF2294 family protein [Calditrichia bacterium]